MKIMKLAAFLLACSSVCFCQETNRAKGRLGAGIEFRVFNFDFGQNNAKFSNFLPRFRQVPVHPDDGYLGLNDKIVIVPDDTIGHGALAAYTPAILPEVRFYRFKARAGVNIAIPIVPRVNTFNGGSTREIHQYDSGTSRGAGTSFAFYAVEASPKPKPGWLGETEFCANEYISFLAGYSVLNYNLRIRTGWDQYDNLETYKNYPLASNGIHKKYAGLRLKYNDYQPTF